MIKTFTLNDLIRYYYKETSDQESNEIQSALLRDPILQEQYREVSKTIRRLDEVNCEPSDKAINAILDYSKKAGLHTFEK